MTRIGYGLDISGYSSAGKTVLAKVCKIGARTAEATIYNVPVFQIGYAGISNISEISNSELSVLSACLSGDCPLTVDIPIDLQNLPSPNDVEWIWQLTKRPVDQAFGGLPPLASFLGAPVARFSNIMRHIGIEKNCELGNTIFESYPRASIELVLGRKPKTYKGCQVRFQDHEWKIEKKPSGKNLSQVGLHEIAREFGFSAADGETWSDDDIDAVICALVGLADEKDLLMGERLGAEISERLKSLSPCSRSVDFCKPPNGYVLLRRNPFREIHLRRENWKIVSKHTK